MSRSITLQPLFRTLALSATACGLALLLPLQAFAQPSVHVSEKDGLLSVQASNTAASALAEVLSEELGISVVVTGESDMLVNIDIVDEPLDKVLTKLSPNYMLVRSSKQPDSSIVEVVLMMGEDSGPDNSGPDDQFLPSGSPADDIVSEEQPLEELQEQPLEELQEQPLEEQPLADDASAGNAQEAAEVSADELPLDENTEALPDGSPEPDSFDPVTGLPIDPLTGLPQQ